MQYSRGMTRGHPFYDYLKLCIEQQYMVRSDIIPPWTRGSDLVHMIRAALEDFASRVFPGRLSDIHNNALLHNTEIVRTVLVNDHHDQNGRIAYKYWVI